MHVELSDTPIVRKPQKQRSDYAGGKQRDIERLNRPFVAWDGEGITILGRKARPARNGKPAVPEVPSHHVYTLFGNSLGARVTGTDLTWRECFPLLMESPVAHHVIYSGTYDVVMMLRDQPKLVMRRILSGQPTYVGQYRIQFRKSKMLRITDRATKKTRTLFDVFTFFGGSFVKACREYLGESLLLDEIAAMKLQRNTFTANRQGEVEAYMSQELSTLVDLMSTLRERLASVDIHPAMWHGPGAVASTVLKRHGVKEHKGDYSDEFRRVAEGAYYGGRFEQFQRGTYEGLVYQYDIRSAYPSSMRLLPSLANATWKHHHGTPDRIEPYGLYHINGRTEHSYGYLPHRRGSGIYYPQWAQGWYWGVECNDEMAIDQYYRFSTKVGAEQPFRFVGEMYDQRASLKQAGQPEQLALKLALNSLYGKLAQSKGAQRNDKTTEWKLPAFHEVVWAGLITAITRRTISDGLHSVSPDSIIATETDSIFSLEPLPLDMGPGLGQWDLEMLEGIKYIQSGVSLVKKQGVWTYKTRGFTPPVKGSEVEVWSDFLSQGDKGILKLNQTRFGTDVRQQHFGEWYETIHKLSLCDNPDMKRRHSWCGQCEKGLTYADCLHPMQICSNLVERESDPYQFVWNYDPELREAMELLTDLLFATDGVTMKVEYVQ